MDGSKSQSIAGNYGLSVKEYSEALLVLAAVRLQAVQVERVNKYLMPRTLTFISCVLILFAVGCVHPTIGPHSIQRDRTLYGTSLADSWKEQTLLNIVKMRYVDPPVFVDIGSIVSSYSLVQGASIAGTIIPKGGSNLPFSGAGTFSNSPTITYTPLTGNAYIKGLLTPLSPTLVFSAIQNGTPADLLLLSSLQSINGLKNQQATWNGITPADPDFYRVLKLIHQIQNSGAVREYVKIDPNNQQTSILSLRAQDISPEIRANMRELRTLLHLNQEAAEFKLVYGSTSSSDTEIAVLTRSIVNLIVNMASEIEVPVDDATQHRVFPGFETNSGTTGIIPLMRIHSSKEKPSDAFVQAYYRHNWFWIDDRDLDSKRVFAQLLQLFTMADTGPKEETLPVVTIPAH